MKFAATLLLASAAAIKLSEPEDPTLDDAMAEVEALVDEAVAACAEDPELTGCEDLAWALDCEDDPEATGCDELLDLAADLEEGLEACAEEPDLPGCDELVDEVLAWLDSDSGSSSGSGSGSGDAPSSGDGS